MHPVYLVHPRYLVHPGHLPDPGDLMRTGEHGHRVLTTSDDVNDTCNNTSDCSRQFDTCDLLVLLRGRYIIIC